MKKGGSGGGNSFVAVEVLLKIWKIFSFYRIPPSLPLQPKVAVVKKHLSLKLFLMCMWFLYV